ncbi:hypothetical protein K438DRAFT_1973322 [Mycena galopus ATCC 62051]|nr:hypothetical protein K438DRAFT_1973322 [Mycena galopus ATCC 62051]
MSFSKPWKGLFDGKMAAYQRTCTDIVVYSPNVGNIVKVAWPIVNGGLVPANLLAQYLRTKNRYLPCFCCFKDAQGVPQNSVFCTIISCYDKTIAVCHYQPGRCQFFLELDILFASATLTDTYGVNRGSPLSGLLSSVAPAQYSEWSRGEAVSIPGYLGEPGQQIFKIVLGEDFVDILKLYLDETFTTLVSTSSFANLVSGAGVSGTQLENLLAKCERCDKIIIARTAHVHDAQCQ